MRLTPWLGAFVLLLPSPALGQKQGPEGINNIWQWKSDEGWSGRWELQRDKAPNQYHAWFTHWENLKLVETLYGDFRVSVQGNTFRADLVPGSNPRMCSLTGFLASDRKSIRGTGGCQWLRGFGTLISCTIAGFSGDDMCEAGSGVFPAGDPAPLPPTGAGAPPPPSGQGTDLTGLWIDDTGGGGIYRLRQVGNRVYWIVDGTTKGSYVNLAYGEITGNTINGIWVDLPGSPSLGGGSLSLRIESSDRLVKVSSSTTYGAQTWTRMGSTQRPPAPVPLPTPPTSAPPAPPGGGGKGQTIGWEEYPAASHRGENGKRFTYTCPGPGYNTNSVWGTDVYTDDSRLCQAAVHAGLITLAAGGTVTVEIRADQGPYTGSSRNGVTSNTYPPWVGSMVFIGGGTVGLGQQRVVEMANIAGRWRSNAGAVYDIAQVGQDCTWKVQNNGETAKCRVAGDQVVVEWYAAGATSPSGKATGVVKRDSNGAVARIEWSNGIIFTK